jgi:hypothetical protein
LIAELDTKNGEIAAHRKRIDELAAAHAEVSARNAAAVGALMSPERPSGP